ncbi:Tn3 family transposase [Streptosporangium sandarakinum]|uniref:Tn3 family transposase n=1 Tax=Streptosporangium sandarakinum TaxID=1260955 RepID=UPI0036B2F6A5
MLGFKLLSRMKNIARQKLVKADPGDLVPSCLTGMVAGNPIDWELIAQQYDQMVKYATAHESADLIWHAMPVGGVDVARCTNRVLAADGSENRNLFAVGHLTAGTHYYTSSISVITRCYNGVREASRRCVPARFALDSPPLFLNACFPGAVNPLLKTLGLPVFCGVGNVALLAASLRESLRPARGGRLRVLGHHRHLHTPADRSGKAALDGAPPAKAAFTRQVRPRITTG